MSELYEDDMASSGTLSPPSSTPIAPRAFPRQGPSGVPLIESLRQAREVRAAAALAETSGQHDNGGTSNMEEVPLFAYSSDEDEGADVDASSDVDSWDLLPSTEQNPRVLNIHPDRYQSFPVFVRSPVEPDDWDEVSVPDENEPPEPEEQPHRDFEIPDFEGRFQETYRFEVESPNAAPYIRVLHGLGHAHRTGNLGRALPRHALRLATTSAVDMAVASRPIVQVFAQASVATYNTVSSTVVETVAPAVVDTVNYGRERLPILFAEAQGQGQELRERLTEGLSPWFEIGAEYAASAVNRAVPERRSRR